MICHAISALFGRTVHECPPQERPHTLTTALLTSRLPLVDIAPLGAHDLSTRRAVAEEILSAAMENGFLYLTNHGVPETLLQSVYDHAATFFDQADDWKLQWYIGRMPNHRGYVPTSEKGDYGDEQGRRRYEAFDLGSGLAGDTIDPSSRLLGPNTWPDQSGFRLTVSRYLSEMRRLSHVMCNAFELALDLEPDAFWRHMSRPVSQLRLLHYLRSGGPTAAVSMGAHTDYECFTILHSRTPALQVLSPDDEWIDAPPIEGAFYFNIGDMFEAWTGGLLVATAHRVIDTGAERFSIPYFAATNYETVIQPMAVPRFHQRDYPPIVAGDHLMSQLLRDFPYLKALSRPPTVSPGLNPFEHRIRKYA